MNIFDEISSERSEPIHILHGTDWWTDCDDLVALRVLLRAHKKGLIVLEGIGINSVMDYSAQSVDAFVFDEGLDIKIGVDKSAYRKGLLCRYQKKLASFEHRINTNDECEQAYLMYRRILAESEKKIDITEVGFPQIIQQLMESKPDSISPLTGLELVEQKVNKIWMMAGRWDKPKGWEYNISSSSAARRAGNYICKNSPVPVTFLGFEVGARVITGNKLNKDDILKVGMVAHGSSKGRSSWDPMTVLLAIIGDAKKAGYTEVFGKANVSARTGMNSFTKADNGLHSYVVKTQPDEYYAKLINEIIE